MTEPVQQAAQEVQAAQGEVQAAERAAVAPSGDRLSEIESRLEHVVNALGHVATSVEQLAATSVKTPIEATAQVADTGASTVAEATPVDSVIVPELPAVVPVRRNRKKEVLRGILGWK